MTKEIALSRGLMTLVDDEDYEWLSQWKWCVSQDKYAVRGAGNRKIRRMVRMHRVIIGALPGQHVDHVNGDPLDNRRENLRICTYPQNQYNRGVRVNNVSGFKGVTWDERNQNWLARIQADGKGVNLGHFDSPVDAALVYDDAARKYHGTFARTNFTEV